MDARHWDDRYRSRPLLWSEGPNRFVEECLSDLTPGTAVDVACGEGRNGIWLAERGWEVEGVDFSTVAVDRGREMARRRGVEVDWVVADVTIWEPEAVFDLALVAYLQLPQVPRDRLMRKVVSWVAEGGHLFLVGHDLSTRGLSGPPDPDVLWTPERAVEAVRPLEVVYAERRPRQIEGGAVAMDTVLLARSPRANGA